MDEILISLEPIAVPTPEPYSKNNPTKQHENLCYVGLQLLHQMKQQGVQISSRMIDGSLVDALTDMGCEGTGDPGDIASGLDAIVEALTDLQFQGVVLDSNGLRIVLTRQAGGILT
jgi:hypothetical protein